MGMMKWVALTAILVLFYLALSPWLTVHRMDAAIERQDSDALASHIDFPSVRQSLKDQLNARIMREMSQDDSLKDNPLASVGAAFAGFVVDQFVDAFVTPAAIGTLMEGEHAMPAAGGQVDYRVAWEAPAEANLSYRTPNRFVVHTLDEQGAAATFVFHRRGLGWKLAEILLPSE